MIAKSNRIETTEIEHVFADVKSQLRQKYKRLDEADDCESHLNQKLPSILSSRGFEDCDHAKAYLKKSLIHEGHRFYQSRIRQIRCAVTNQEIADLAQQQGILRDRRNQPCSFDWELETDVRDVLSKLPSTDQLICEAIMRGETCENMGMTLGVSKQRAQAIKSNFLERAKRHYFKDFIHDLN